MNPFKKDGEMLPIASINSVYIDDTLAYDLFRPSLITQELINNKNELQLNDATPTMSLQHAFNTLLTHNNTTINHVAKGIAVKYGNRLGMVLGTLLSPTEKSVRNRNNWNKQHWNYWASIEQIYIVGGLVSPLLTTIFLEEVHKEFRKRNVSNVTVTFIEGSQNMGTKGMASVVDNGDYLLFDFGQTSIKRHRHLKNSNHVLIDSVLDSIPSQFLDYKDLSERELQETSVELDQFIQNTVLQTAKETGFTGSNIYIAIANYVSKGVIYPSRGGYGKLCYIADNYEKYLQQELSRKCNKKIDVTLFHDTSAMALQFTDKKNTAVISLGTAFGVAFP